MTESFDLTAAEELAASRNDLPEDVHKAALKLRNDPDSPYSGDMRPIDVVFEELSDSLTELRESRESAESKREELRGRIVGDDDTSDSEGTEAELSEAERKRREIRERIGR